MTAREIIHASEDVQTVLRIAVELGMVIQRDAPSDRPEPQVIKEDEIDAYDRGVFILYRPQWVLGKPEFQPITAGHNRGKFFQRPRVNIAPITLSLGGERLDGDVRRLGGGSISRHADWLRGADQTLQPTPHAVRSAYDSIIRRIDVGKRLRGGVHTYIVLAHAWEKLASGLALPPFDYVEWPPHTTT